MLQTIRDRASGWIAYAVILLISIPFALWGVNNYLNDGSGKQVVATISGVSISTREFAQAYRAEKLRIEQIFGGNLPSGFDDKKIKQLVLQNLVRRAVINNEASKAGYKVTDIQLLQQLKQYPAFAVDGKFSASRYQQLLQQNGMTPEIFENKLRQELSDMQLQNGIVKTAFVTPEESARLSELKNEKRQVVTMTLPLVRYKNEVKVSAKAIEDYYNAHKSEFVSPEKVKLSYLQLNANKLALPNPTDSDLRSYYERHSTEFAQPEQAKAREIVVKLGGTGNPGATQRLKAISAQLAAGESFAVVAKKYSEASNAKDGGLLGPVTKQDLPPQLSAVLFALKPGDVSPPVKYGQKIYRYKLEQLQNAVRPAFEQVRAKVKVAYLKHERNIRFSDLVQRLQVLTYKNPGTLIPAAKSMNQKVLTTGWLTQGTGSGIASNPAVRAAAFSDAVYKNGTNSQVIELNKHEAVVVRIDARQGPVQKPLSAVRKQIHDVIARQDADNLARKAASQLASAIKAGGKVEAVAKKQGIATNDLGWIGRHVSQSNMRALTKAVFETPAPKAGAKSAGFIRLPNGDYEVFAVLGTKYPAVKTASAAASRRYDAMIGQTELQMAYGAWEAADAIKVYPQNMSNGL